MNPKLRKTLHEVTFYLAAAVVLTVLCSLISCASCDELCQEDARYERELVRQAQAACVLPYYWDGRVGKCREPQAVPLW